MKSVAEARRAFLGGQPLAPDAVRDVIAASWLRCRNAAPDPARLGAGGPAVPAADLVRRLEAGRTLIEAARPHLQWLSLQGADVPHWVSLADADAVVLAGAGRFALDCGYCPRPGFDSSERAVGTNGIGTALAAGAPVVVRGREHYLDVWDGAT
jgi:transcriptional regulator of acetoin/glycerol metabolism